MIKLSYPRFWQSNSLLSFALLPLSAIYFFLGKFRSLLSTPCRLPSKVICIGNATVGGTGKTQVVIWLAKQLKAKGLKPVILCKGYGGSFKAPMVVSSNISADIVGDEALELCEYAPTIVSRKPHAAIQLLKSLSPDIIIVDDGMQNPGFIKDCIIMVVDGARGFGNQKLFPAGPMRQSVRSSLQIADAVIIINIASDSYASVNGLDRVTSLHKTYEATIVPNSILNPQRKYYAFAGIGNPERFFALCNSLGAVEETKAFPDHHKYSEDEIKDLQNRALQLNAELITTRKDYVKLKLPRDIIPINVDLEIAQDQNLLDLILSKHLRAAHSNIIETEADSR